MNAAHLRTFEFSAAFTCWRQMVTVLVSIGSDDAVADRRVNRQEVPDQVNLIIERFFAINDIRPPPFCGRGRGLTAHPGAGRAARRGATVRW